MSDILRHELPWKAVFVGGSWDVTTDTGDPRDEFSVLEYATEADCKFIASACNSHADLLAACKAALNGGGSAGEWERTREVIRAAVAKAEGPQAAGEQGE